jgi:two-component system cell cycle sensor histidine kinase/response regulator CckA
MPTNRYAARIRGLLEITRIVRESDSLPSKLERIADAIAESLSYGTVAINLYRPEWDDFEVAAVHGSAEARTALSGRTRSADFFDPLLDSRFEHDGVYLIPHDEVETDPADWFVPELPASDEPDAWHPEDALVVPLLAADGHVLGHLTVDQPESGCRPTDEELEVLVAFGAHAAQAIESAQEAEVSARYRGALEQLLAVSSQLTGSASVESVLQAVCDAARDALGFELAVIELADRDSDRYRPVAAAGIELTDPHLQLDVPIATLDRIFDPRFEREGCCLLEHEDGVALLGVAPTSYESSRNGRGPRAWNRHWLAVPLRDADGSVAGFIWADDPTDRLIPEGPRLQGLRTLANQAATVLDAVGRFEALRAAEELQSTMLAATPIGTIFLGLDGRVRSWNDAARRMFGFTDAEVIGREPAWIEDEQREDFRRRFRALVEGGEVEAAVYTDQHADGTVLRVRTTSAPVHDSTGAPTGVIAAIEDITEQERAATDLERRNSELEALNATTLNLLDGLDIGSTLETIVSRAGELVGTSSGYLYLVDEDADELVVAIARGAFEGNAGVRQRRGEGFGAQIWETGEPLAVEDYASWPGRLERHVGLGFRAIAGVPLWHGLKVVGVLGVAYDEPERTFGETELALLGRFGHLASLALNNARLYDELHKSQELYRTVVESSRDVIMLLDLDGGVQYASPSQHALLGYPAQELVGASALSIVHPDDVEAVRESVATALRGGESRPYAARVRHRDGHWVDVEGLPAPIPGEDGRAAAILGVVRDVTERKRIEEASRHAQESLAREKENTERLIESANAMVVGLDRAGLIQVFNAEAERVTGYSREEVEGRNWFDFLTPRDRYPEVWEMFETSMRRGSMPEVFENELVTKSGEERLISWRNGLAHSADGELQGLTAFGIDQTHRLNLEEQLRQSQKMEAIGQLAGGIAHDFNNLLTAITGYGDLALAKLAEDDPVRRNVKEMCRAGERASALTKQLLAYSRKQVLQPKVMRLNDAVEGMESMLARLLGEHVELSAHLADDLGYTRADPGQIEQVLMNLAINARDAMPEGGRLTITTANVQLDDGFALHHVGAAPGEYVMLAVSDTGEGMDRETLERMFDPFFTTKPAGQGTGLGLSTVYGIVTQTGGQIWPYSEPGRGTTFKVYLPRVWERMAEREEHVSLPHTGGTETVLLVEDEDIVRMLVQEMLEDDGYSVLSASSGEAALELSRSYPGRIDVLMTDVVMPGLSGQQLAAQLVGERPEVLVVFASGYTEDAIANHGVLRPGTAFIEKPFSAPDLARTLRDLLDTQLAA